MNLIKKLLGSKVVENSIWLMLLQVFNTVVPMLTLPYITRILEPEGYGYFSLALNWILYFQVLVEYGFGFWGARKVAMCDGEGLQNVYSTIITARIFLLAVSFALINVVCIVVDKGTVHYYCMLLLFSMIIGTAFQLTWLFQGKQDMKFITMVNAVARLLSVICVFLFVKSKDHLYLYCLLYSCTFVFSSIIGMIVANRKYGLKFRLTSVSNAFRALKEVSALFLSNGMSKVLSSFGVTVLGMVASSSMVGIYSAIHKVPSVINQFFTPISQAIYPSVSVAFGQSNAAGISKVKRIAKLVVPVFVLGIALLILLRFPIVNLAFGKDYVGYSDIIIPLCMWLIVGIINNFLGVQMLVASGNQTMYTKAFSLASLISVILNIMLGKIWGLYGIAWATFASELAMTAVLLLTLKKVFGTKTQPTGR